MAKRFVLDNAVINKKQSHSFVLGTAVVNDSKQQTMAHIPTPQSTP
jgi:hypothetical protein